ncbi:hypothetical protein PINS_up002591 [Pythium insidiosum]|nr:hypothetical protein PINS_up002591 [Pythium insidiosum]
MEDELARRETTTSVTEEEEEEEEEEADADDIGSKASSSVSRRLRKGSLFFELSRQIKLEMAATKRRSEHSRRASRDPETHSDEGDDPTPTRFASNTGGESPGNNSPHGADERSDDDMLKEFFMLTAAAVKISGVGLRNDACNIHNEDLYDEAMALGITFDQFHRWLETRLEDGAPERVVQ